MFKTSVLFLLIFATPTLSAEPWPIVAQVDRQPLLAQVVRLRDALDQLGSPLSTEVKQKLDDLKHQNDDREITKQIQNLLDPLCLVALKLRSDLPPIIMPREGSHELVEGGWRTFLVKVLNEPNQPVRLIIRSPNSQPLPEAQAADIPSRWLGLSQYEGRPLAPTLSGLNLEYRLVEIFSRAVGEGTAELDFSAPVSHAPLGTKAKPSLIHTWRFDKNTAGWKPLKDVQLKVANGSLVAEPTGPDPYFAIDFSEPAKPGPLMFRFWGRAEGQGTGQLFWWTKNLPQADGQRVLNFALDSGREQLFEIPILESEAVTGLRLDPDPNSGKLRIDWAELAYASGWTDRSTATFSFTTKPSVPVTFHIVDEADRPAVACFEIRDHLGRIYPPLTKRLAPDFAFHRQIYRENGESIRLPLGKYTILCSRGPESIPETINLVVDGKPATIDYRIKRWIDPSRRGYWSGDHHIHAAGCTHYSNPTEGVSPIDMIRHCMGEDLKVGCCLTWQPCFDFQKQFFTGKVDKASRPPYFLRYDVEVSGFGSSPSGHLNLLGLTVQMPAGGDTIDHWPTLGLNTLRWAKKQGATCGTAHSAMGLTDFVGRLPKSDGLDGPGGLPNFNIPSFSSIGANEFIMQVAHEVPGPEDKPVPAIDFIASMNTDRTAEWNMWYHILNCGFRVKASGETDFPCISGERVGMGRTYVKLDGPLDFDRWLKGMAAGRSYISDGRTHLIDFSAGPINSGGEVHLKEPGELTFSVDAAVRSPDQKTASVELIVNGYPVGKQEIISDGHGEKLSFKHNITKSSWASVRVFPSGHTNPIFVIVNDKPIRANAKSAEWCLQSLDECWKSKSKGYAIEERNQAAHDNAVAREVYRRILEEAQ